MKGGYLPKQQTLLTEIRDWKHTENICKEVYNEEALKSRSFLKMKMRAFQGLYRKYDGSSLSLDEKALHRMLRYHYQRIEKELYPNLMVRMGRRAGTALKSKMEGLVKGSAEQDVFNSSNMESVIASSNGGSMDRGAASVLEGKERGKEQAKEQTTNQRNLPEGWWINDLGRKDKSQDKGQNKKQQQEIN